MIVLPEKEQCCGCGACMAGCPRQAITMENDLYGYVYPRIDQSQCIECKRCLSVCHFNKQGVYGKETQKVYAAAAKDTAVLEKSASGGIFAVVAERILENNGVVYGATWNDDFSVHHIGIKDHESLKKLQGSKYSQSCITECFEEIKDNLNKEIDVLFSGTPCQVAALYSFLGRDNEHLTTIDIICHGVPSNQMLQDEITYLETLFGDKATSLSFRAKDDGWGTSGKVRFEGRAIKYDITNSPYYYYFLNNAIFRDSCYNCHYAGANRVGDLTIGDYWKIESAHPNISIDIEKGISCILVNSDKGSNLLKKCADRLELIDSSLENISKRNGQLVAPSKPSKDRAAVLERYAKRDYSQVVKTWKRETFKERLIEKVKDCIPKRLKKALKRLVNRK